MASRVYDKLPPPGTRELWQYNAKLTQECRELRKDLWERTEERDELIESMFGLEAMINNCYDQLDKMTDIITGIDTLYKEDSSSSDGEN